MYGSHEALTSCDNVNGKGDKSQRVSPFRHVDTGKMTC